MNASELNRKLLYCGLSDLTDYLRNSPLNRYLYKELLDELPHRKIDTPIVTMFNEIYYQCVRVRYDGNPGQDVFKRYLDAEARWLNSKLAAGLVFDFVWVLFNLRSNLSFHEECFLEKLTPLIEKSDYSAFSRQLLINMKDEDMWLSEELPTMSCPVKDIPLRYDADTPPASKIKQVFLNMLMDDENFSEMRVNPWRIVTNGFSRSSIEDLLRLYHSIHEQLALVDRIQLAIPPNEKEKFGSYFMYLLQQIKVGVYLPQYHKDIKYNIISNLYIEEEEVRSFAAGTQQKEEEDAENEQREQREEDLELLKKQLEEQRYNYEMKIASIESKYQREIEGLIKELNSLKDNEKVESQPQEGQMLSLIKMITHVKEQFSKAAAEEFVNMFYHISMAQGRIDETSAMLVDSIVPAIIKRDSHHTQVDVTTAHQVNINPHRVINEEKEK